MRRGRRFGIVLAAALWLMSSACAPRSPASAAPTFTVQGIGEPITLRAWSFCNDKMCADGRPPDNPPDVGAVGQVRVRFSEPGWTLTAEFQAQGDSCARSYSVPLSRVTDSEWVLDPGGPAGTYDVELIAGGNPYGGAVATFRWTTRSRGTMPAPAAQLLTEYFELHVSNLATTPKKGLLMVSVTAADGKTATVRPEQWRPEDQGASCAAPGRIDFYAADSGSRPDLGPAPLHYDVRLTLDGRQYRADAVVPRDTKNDGHEYVDLAFSPALPAFTG